MYKVIIWGTGYFYNKYINCVRMQELVGNLSIQGVTSNEENVFHVDGYHFVPKAKISNIEYDYCVVAVRDFHAVLKEAQISIISRNCWGGICYNYLGLPFNTPFINMFFNDSEFNKLLKRLDYYLPVPLEFERMDFDSNLKCEYPVGRLDDIFLYFNHYIRFEEAKACYDRRKQRINKRNLIFISQTVSKSVEKEFDSIPYERKIIFVPYDSTLKSSIRINYTDVEMNSGISIGMKSNAIANGHSPLFNILSFLNGKGDFLRIREVQKT